MVKGQKHSKETKVKMSKAHKGDKHHLFGKHHSEETRKKIGLANSIALKGRNINGDKLIAWVKKNGAWNKNKKCPQISEKMKGKLLSEATKKKISLSSKGKKLTKKCKEMISEKLKGRMPKNIMKEGIYMNIKRGWFEINGKKIFFRSKWEANYALYLDFLVKQKEILKWEYETDVFIFEKIKFGTRSYRPDFKIFNNNGSYEYHEIKGYMDNKSKTKFKRMAKFYPDIKIILIDKDIYKTLLKWRKLLKFF